MTNEEAIFIINNRLNTYYCTDEDLKALDKAIEALKNEIPQGMCKNCKAYKQYGLRSDGFCGIPRMTSEGEQYINVNGNFYCSYFEDKREADND